MSELRSMPVIHAASPSAPGHVGRGRTDARGPFAAENLRLVRARIFVVVERVRHHFLLRAVIMLVHQIRHAALNHQRSECS